MKIILRVDEDIYGFYDEDGDLAMDGQFSDEEVFLAIGSLGYKDVPIQNLVGKDVNRVNYVGFPAKITSLEGDYYPVHKDSNLRKLFNTLQDTGMLFGTGRVQSGKPNYNWEVLNKCPGTPEQAFREQKVNIWTDEELAQITTESHRFGVFEQMANIKHYKKLTIQDLENSLLDLDFTPMQEELISPIAAKLQKNESIRHW